MKYSVWTINFCVIFIANEDNYFTRPVCTQLGKTGFYYMQVEIKTPTSRAVGYYRIPPEGIEGAIMSVDPVQVIVYFIGLGVVF